MRNYTDIIVKTLIAIAVMALIINDAMSLFGAWQSHEAAKTVADAGYATYRNLASSKEAQASALQSAREYGVQLTGFGVENGRVIVETYSPPRTTFVVHYVPALKEYLSTRVRATSPSQ